MSDSHKELPALPWILGRTIDEHDRVALAVGSPIYAVESGWLVEVVDKCTCGGSGILSPAHQPGCGRVPLVEVEAALTALSANTQVLRLLDCAQLVEPGCCSSCSGTGTVFDESTGGRCSDCRATGHAHGPVEPDELNDFIAAVRRVATNAEGAIEP